MAAAVVGTRHVIPSSLPWRIESVSQYPAE
jgi:hypothetical protein